MEKFKKKVEELIKELPDWAKDQQFTILAGMEVLVEYTPGQKINIKKTRCIMCGQCCMTLIPNSGQTPYGVDDEGKCKALRKEGDKWICSAGEKKPYFCLHDPLKENTEECVIDYI